jgi:hypothetical protein
MATNDSYTPGPWDYDMEFIVAPDPGGRHPDIYIAEIAHSDEEGRIASPQQQDANRRLIAAAPELLEALKDLLGELPSVQSGVCQHCGREYDDIFSGECPSDDCPSFKARAAITEATGEEPELAD